MLVRFVNLRRSVLPRLLHEVVLACVLIGLVASELPLEISAAPQESLSPTRSCCASANKTASLASCGCTLQKQSSGTCCCRGSASQTKPSSDSDTPSYRSCPCAPEETRWISFSQPRVPIATATLSCIEPEIPCSCELHRLPGIGCPEPEIPPPRCS